MTEYFDLEAASGQRHEYRDGEIIAMRVVHGLKIAARLFSVAAVIGIVFGVFLLYKKQGDIGVAIGFICIGFGFILASTTWMIRGIAEGVRLLAVRD